MHASNGLASQLSTTKLPESQIKTQKNDSKIPSSQKPDNSIVSKYQSDKGNLNNGIVNIKDETGRHFNTDFGIKQLSSAAGEPNSNATPIKNEETTKEARKEAEVPSSPPSLPDNLPLILVAGIQNLKDAAANCQNGKCRFFDASVNKTLLG